MKVVPLRIAHTLIFTSLLGGAACSEVPDSGRALSSQADLPSDEDPVSTPEEEVAIASAEATEVYPVPEEALANDEAGVALEAVPSGAPTDVAMLPADFDPTEEVIFSTPMNEVYKNDVLNLIAQTSNYVPVTILLNAEAERGAILTQLAPLGATLSRVRFVVSSVVMSRGVWTRDFGPQVVKTTNDDVRIIDPQYYPSYVEEDGIPSQLAARMERKVSVLPIRLEGGNLLSDGVGNCLVSTQALADNSSKFSIRQVRAVLRKYYGCQATYFLPGLKFDATKHVDMYLTFFAPGAVLVGQMGPDPVDATDVENAKRMNEAAERLAAAGFVVRRVRMPYSRPPGGRKQIATTMNPLIVDGAVFVPTYRSTYKDPEWLQVEKEAFEAFQQAFPGRKVIQIDGHDLIRKGSGGFHCVGMNSHRHLFGKEGTMILGPTTTGGINSREASTSSALGHAPTVVSAAQWAALSSAEVASYRAVILGDPTCASTPAPYQAAAQNASTWSKWVDGNKILVLTDPVYHWARDGAKALITSGIRFAASREGRTGLYATFGCAYSNSVASTVASLAGFGNVVVTKASEQKVSIVASVPGLTGLTSAALSNWSESVHGHFTTYPPTFKIFATGAANPYILTEVAP